MKLRWVMRRRKGHPMFILQRLVSEDGWGEKEYWENVPVVDDGKAHEEIPDAEWIAAAVKQAWKDRKAKAKEKNKDAEPGWV